MGSSNSTQRRTTPPTDPSEYVVNPPRRSQIYPTYDQLVLPNLSQLRDAAYKWDQIAKNSALDYAFTGSFVALLSGAIFDIQRIEILVGRNATADSAQTLRDIWDNEVYLAISTHSNQAIILVTENKGIAVQFFAPGEHGYPESLVPPSPVSATTGAPYADLEPNFRLKDLGHQSVPAYLVPVIQARVILKRKLLRFNFNPTDQNQVMKNRRDCIEINALLNCTASDGDDRFPPDVVFILFPIIKYWIPYAKRFLVPTSWEAVCKWYRLGLPLTAADVSENQGNGQ
jgi:hypothetical protein